MGHMVVVGMSGRLALGDMVLGMDVVLVVGMALGMALGLACGMVVVMVVHMGHMGYVVGMVVGMDDGILVRSMDRMGCRSSIWR